jgi:putative hydrolase of HD superfamily
MDIDSITDFLKEAEKFKTCLRTCRTTSNGRVESDAEHSWHLALFLLLLEKEFNHLDLFRMLKLALIHDLPELYAGDTNPYRGDTKNKAENERKAAEKLFHILPEEMAQDLTALFNEYTAQESVESKIVKAVDKLMPLIQNLCTNKHHSSYRELNVTYDEVIAYMDPFFSEGILKDFYRKLLSEAHRNGVFSDYSKTPEPSVVKD